ncbi:prolactin releasing hormone 2 [Heptranchias perlo]|uniref:prolactin releasing hormone 2 n=1 Tax=Heptranchias perlo TaxID=212740 RepID=UPI0035593952
MQLTYVINPLEPISAIKDPSTTPHGLLAPTYLPFYSASVEDVCLHLHTMLTSTFCSPWSLMNQQQGQRKKVKLVAICTALLFVSMIANTAQSRGLSHQIDNRNSDIDPFWYVGRGVRPIGRFGKRQMKSSDNLRPTVNNLELILNALREQNAFNSNQQQGGEDTY